MNEKVIINNLIKGMKIKHIEHIQGFPDASIPELRMIYSLIYSKMKDYYFDPIYKAAAILSIISISGGLITITRNGYRCNNGFLDSSKSFNYSYNPVIDNLKIMAEYYVNDDYFADKAIHYFYSNGEEDKICELKNYYELIEVSIRRCQNSEDLMILNLLKKIFVFLSDDTLNDISVHPIPQSWDSKAWLDQFLPIYNRRIRSEQHSFRAQYYKQHISIVEDGCYISQSGKEVKIPWDAYGMMKSSKIYSAKIDIMPLKIVHDTTIEVWNMDCLDAAKKIQLATEGITAVLNLANRQNPGGGVFTGSGAQEESCFLRSNYFTALYPYADYAYKYDLPKSKQQYPLDRDYGGVWSTGITVFRGCELDGYPLLDEPWKTNFIAVAAINRPRTIEENGEIRLHPDMIQGTINKIRTIMNIAIDNNVSNLVLGALGCGAFHNPPKHIAELFAQVLNEPPYKGRFNRIVFAITGEKLCKIFEDALQY